MTNNKQTSVELFALTLYENGLLVGDGDLIQAILDLHKGVHRQQIVEAYKAAMGTEYLESHIMTRYGAVHKAHDYYNKTYGGSEQ